MRMRPLLVSAACSGIAALALIISEGAISGAHVPRVASGGGASTPQARDGGGAANSGQGSSGTFDTGEATSSPDQQSSDQMPAGGGNDQPSQPKSGGVDPGSLARLVPVPTPIPIGP